MSHPLVGTGWAAEPLVLAGLALGATLYANGWRRLGTLACVRSRPPRWRAWCYAGGLATLGLATLSPLHAWGEHLFAAHMVQHLLLVMVAAPLLWLGAPLVPVLWGLPRAWRRAVGRLFVPASPVQHACRALVRPWAAVTLAIATVAVWHWPALYDAAQGRALAHDLEHALFLGSALLFWWPLVYPVPGRRPLLAGGALIYLAVPMIVSDAIGAVLSFAQVPLYATYAAGPAAPGLSPLADQQLGGLIMWVGGGLLWLAAMALVLFVLPGEEGIPARRGQARAAASRSA